MLKKGISRDFWFCFFGVMLGIFGMVLFERDNTPAITHNYIVERSGKEALKVQAIIDSNPKYKNLTASAMTGGLGALWIRGYVNDTQVELALMKAVLSLNLPVPLYWDVKIIE